MTFRIMPRQVNSRPNEPHTRFGFAMFHHPKGDPERDGMYVASWDDWDTAMAAAFCLRIDPHLISAIGWLPYIEPKEEDWRSVGNDPPDWKDVGKWVEFQKDGDPTTRWRGQLDAEGWFTGEEEIPICKVAERSIYDFTHWRILHEKEEVRYDQPSRY